MEQLRIIKNTGEVLITGHEQAMKNVWKHVEGKGLSFKEHRSYLVNQVRESFKRKGVTFNLAQDSLMLTDRYGIVLETYHPTKKHYSALELLKMNMTFKGQNEDICYTIAIQDERLLLCIQDLEYPGDEELCSADEFPITEDGLTEIMTKLYDDNIIK